MNTGGIYKIACAAIIINFEEQNIDFKAMNQMNIFTAIFTSSLYLTLICYFVKTKDLSICQPVRLSYLHSPCLPLTAACS